MESYNISGVLGLLKEKVIPKKLIFFVNANENLALTLATKVQVLLIKFASKEAQNSNIIAAILTIT